MIKTPMSQKIKYRWEWRTGSLIRETKYSGLCNGGEYAGQSQQVLLCLWGWTVPAPQ